MTDDMTHKRDRLVISSDDLDASIPVAQASTPSTPPAGALPGLSAPPPRTSVQFGGSGGINLMQLGSNTVISGAVAGVVGGALGMILAEIFHNPDHQRAFTDAGGRFNSGVWVAILGAVLGFVLMAWDGITTGAHQRAWREGAKGAAIGAGAGFVGGYVAQWIYSSMLENIDYYAATESEVKNKVLLARGVGWGVFGALAGVGLGLNGGPRKMVNGVIGGAVGGALGGFAFQQLSNSSTSSNGSTVRFIGCSLTGVGIGLGMGLVERLRRDAWLLIASGPMAGKEFILYNERTSIGADFRSDIVLVKDPAVAPEHLALLREPNGNVSILPLGSAPVLVNGGPIGGQQRLRAGDRLSVGSSELVYQERATAT